MNDDITFGSRAGPLGDLNGDGNGDFYILGTYSLYELHGRKFDRHLASDIDRDGAVDFTNLAAMYSDNYFFQRALTQGSCYQTKVVAS